MHVTHKTSKQMQHTNKQMPLKLQENVTMYVGQAGKPFANVNRLPCPNKTTRGTALH